LNKFYKILFTVIILCITIIKSNAQEKITINHADSLVGKAINGEQVREANGNVSLTQGDVHITASRVIQFFDQNKAELYGNVHVVKDTLNIYCPTGIYYGNEGKVVCPDGATLTDPKATLKANNGTYLFSQDIAQFRGHVSITDNSTYTITSDALDYYRQVSKSYANGNVKIVTDSAVITSDNLVYEKLIGISTGTGNVKIESDSTIITSDKLTHYHGERKSIADNNVKIDFTNQNAVITGNHGENYERTNYSLVKGKSKLVQIESKDNKIDTLFIDSDKMESFRNKPEYYIATDSVKVIRTDFLASSKIAYYYRDISGKGGVMSLSRDPAVWKEELQVTGDSIYAFFRDEIDSLFVNKSAFALKPNEKFADRFDQMSGVFMFMRFKNNNIDYIRVDTNAASIYYSFEENNNPGGANKAAGERITLFFTDKNVELVKVVGMPKGTFYPEGVVNPSELRLLGFRIRNDKPVRQ
jgi:lipopolysaccharide assembly outer membrane protein LptD (OstA)